MPRYNPILGSYEYPYRGRYASMYNGYNGSSYRFDRYDSIMERLRARMAARRAARALRYGERRNNRPDPVEEDAEAERRRIDENRRRMMEELEARLKEEEEKRAREEAERLERIRKENAVIMVQSVDEHIQTNTESHHTDEFHCTEGDNAQLVVRRGQEFRLTLTFQKPYNREKDDLYIIFEIGEKPKIHKKTKAVIKLREDEKTRYKEGKKRSWGARIESENGNTLVLQVYSPPNAVIGTWRYTVRTVKEKDEEDLEYDANLDLVLLFNPWCPDDQTYMEDTRYLNEYVLEENGIAFVGSSYWIRNKSWYYGQFQKDILKVSLQLLRQANQGIVNSKFADPVWVSRALSRVINHFDQGGVLVGNWSGDYKGGTKPTSWTGSVAILQQFLETGEPVKYGQCWVFSHVLTTVARALGLPCRSVTNFSSAHDTDLTMTIDKYLDEESAEEIDWMSGDSVWNFHVWNEVHMLRPDLNKAYGVNGKYDGWQAVDATPQELSDDIYQCGPSPLTAIKLGEVLVGHDTKFIFGEVNADVCTWSSTDQTKLLRKETGSVGISISTKNPAIDSSSIFASERLDVTDLYKAPEGSAAERAAVEKATSYGEKGEHLFVNETGIELELIEQSKAEIGNDFVVKVKVKNVSDSVKNVRTRINVRPTTNEGVLIRKTFVDKMPFEKDTLNPKQEVTKELHVSVDEYVDVCDDAMSMRIMALVRVRGHLTDPVFVARNFVLNPPQIPMRGPSEPVPIDDSFQVKFTLVNPLPQKELTECVLTLDGTVYLEGEGITLKNGVYKIDIGTLKGSESRTLQFTGRPTPKPKNSKRRDLSVALASKELPDLEGNLVVKLQ